MTIDRASVLFHLLARAVADRLIELAPAEREALEAVCSAKEEVFPRQAAAVRHLLRELPPAPPEANRADALWQRSEPQPDSADPPISHGQHNTEAEEKALERLLASPGRLGTVRTQVLQTLLRHAAYHGGAMTKIELAEILGVMRDRVHPRIMELEKGGWVVRRPELVDGRPGILFAPTAKAVAWGSSPYAEAG